MTFELIIQIILIFIFNLTWLFFTIPLIAFAITDIIDNRKLYKLTIKHTENKTFNNEPEDT